MAVQSRIVLEPSAQGIVDATSTPPFLYELEPAQARKVLDDLQAAPIEKLPIEEEWITVPAAVGDVPVRIVKPVGKLRAAAGHRLHARRRLDPGQRRHARSARPRACRGRRARRCCSSSTPTRPRRTTRSRSSRATPRRSGRSAKAPPRAWTLAAWLSPESPSAVTWLQRSR